MHVVIFSGMLLKQAVQTCKLDLTQYLQEDLIAKARIASA